MHVLCSKLSIFSGSPITEKPFVVDFCNKNVINGWIIYKCRYIDVEPKTGDIIRLYSLFHGTTSNHQIIIFKSKECFKKLTRLQKTKFVSF